MSNPFFDQPILNSPYEYPRRHWELDESGQPTTNADATAHAMSQVGDPHDLSRGKSIAQLKNLRSFEKFADEFRTLTETNTRLDRLAESLSGDGAAKSSPSLDGRFRSL